MENPITIPGGVPEVVYRPVDAFNGHKLEGYAFGTDGNVWSRWVKGVTTMSDEWRQMAVTRIKRKQGSKTVWRRYVVLRTGRGQGRTFLVSNLIAAAHLGPCPEGLEVCHENGISDDDRAENLRYDTHKSNQEDIAKHGRTYGGEEHHHAKMTDELVRQMREEYAAGATTPELGRKYHIDASSALDIVSGRTWKYAPGPISKDNRHRSGPQPTLTPEQQKEVLERYQTGTVAQHELAKEFGVSQDSISRICLKAGASQRITDAERDKICELYQTGLNCRDVAKQVGLSNSAVERTLRKRGIAIRQTENAKPRTTATELQKIEIRALYKTGCFGQHRLAKAYNLSRTSIQRIVTA